MLMKSLQLVAVMVISAVVTLFSGESQSALIDSHSILVSHRNERGLSEIIEFSRTGEVRQTFLIPNGTGFGSGEARALAMDQKGKVQIFNGTFSPYLTTLTPQSAAGAATFEHHTIAGWSVVNNTSYGAVALDPARNAIYVNDMSTASPGGPTGIIRFDSTTYAATRVRSGEYTKVTLGLDGLLYASFPATMPGNNKLDVIDPVNFSLLRTVTLPTNGLITFTGFAVDAAGSIYATEGREFGTGIDKFTPQGVLIKHKGNGTPWLHDLALSPDGKLVTLSHDGDVVMTTTELTSITSFQSTLIDSDFSFVAWAVPEPPAGSLLILVICGFAARRPDYRP